MGLFNRKSSDSLGDAIKMVEKILKEWKVDPATVKAKDADRWYLVQGSADFHIEFFKYNKGGEKGEVDCVEVGSVIMKLPQENFLPLYRRILELNASGVGCYFGIRKDLVMLLSTRELTGLDYVELKTMVDDVRIYADYWDDILIKEFGGSK